MMIKMNNYIQKGDILRNIPKPNLEEGIDYDNINNFKKLCDKNMSDAISFLLFDNINYYLTIINDFYNLANDFLVGAILDSIYKAIKEIDYSKSMHNYVSFSGIILKRKLIDKVESNNFYKRKIDSKNVAIGSYEDIDRNNTGIDEDMVIQVNSPLNSFDKIELRNSIKNSDLIEIRKQILLMLVESEGKITNKDISDELGFTRQNVSYHLKVIKRDHKDLLEELF